MSYEKSTSKSAFLYVTAVKSPLPDANASLYSCTVTSKGEPAATDRAGRASGGYFRIITNKHYNHAFPCLQLIRHRCFNAGVMHVRCYTMGS